MIELRIAHTSREAGRNKDWYYTADTRESFPTIRAAKDWLKSMFGANHQPMYCDTHEGTRKVGRVYKTKERENGITYYCQYWVSMYELSPLTLDED